MKISIITIVLNNREYIESCIKSVIGQTYKDVEYIVVDGGSTDGTLDIVEQYKDRIDRIIRGKDAGIYQAINIGIAAASGDVIGFLHSDDLYADENVLKKVAEAFISSSAEAVYSDLKYVNRHNVDSVIRYWKSGSYDPGKLKEGWSLPHPTFFVKTEIYDKFGMYDTSLKISADYEMMIRLLFKNTINVKYIPEVLVKMRAGGVSNRNISTIVRKTREDYRAWKIHGVKRAYGTVIRKNIYKIPQFFTKKR
ncbi:MAG: glycosyltransferase family 2 protein [Candidatus Omnitrophota bacterium]|nr:glycosyltransferase family 2 protein [Candidatus Omnitrophota bacterium]